jgi:hypothetical protein
MLPALGQEVKSTNDTRRENEFQRYGDRHEMAERQGGEQVVHKDKLAAQNQVMEAGVGALSARNHGLKNFGDAGMCGGCDFARG